MAIPADPRLWRVGLVGYGEVGRILAEDLRERLESWLKRHR